MPRILTAIAILLLAFSSGIAGASGIDNNPYGFVEGQHYRVLDTPRNTHVEDGNVLVTEFFWYGCPHCYKVEPHISTWLQEKPGTVQFERVPATLNRGWVPLARAYYVAEQLGVTDTMHKALFAEIHENRNMLQSAEDIAAVFEANTDVDQQTFNRTFKSLRVNTRIKQADDLARHYKLQSVPTIIIGGKYLATAHMAGSYEGLLQVTRHLVERELAAGSESPAEDSQ